MSTNSFCPNPRKINILYATDLNNILVIISMVE